jgi:hypothetical protein
MVSPVDPLDRNLGFLDRNGDSFTITKVFRHIPQEINSDKDVRY